MGPSKHASDLNNFPLVLRGHYCAPVLLKWYWNIPFNLYMSSFLYVLCLCKFRGWVSFTNASLACLGSIFILLVCQYAYMTAGFIISTLTTGSCTVYFISLFWRSSTNIAFLAVYWSGHIMPLTRWQNDSLFATFLSIRLRWLIVLWKLTTMQILSPIMLLLVLIAEVYLYWKFFFLWFTCHCW